MKNAIYLLCILIFISSCTVNIDINTDEDDKEKSVEISTSWEQNTKVKEVTLSINLEQETINNLRNLVSAIETKRTRDWSVKLIDFVNIKSSYQWKINDENITVNIWTINFQKLGQTYFKDPYGDDFIIAVDSESKFYQVSSKNTTIINWNYPWPSKDSDNLEKLIP